MGGWRLDGLSLVRFPSTGVCQRIRTRWSPYLHPFFIWVPPGPERVPLDGQPAGSETPFSVLTPRLSLFQNSFPPPWGRVSLPQGNI